MNKILAPFLFLTLVSCGPSLQEKEEIAIITCNVLEASRSMDAAMRIKEINAAREKMGEDAFLGNDDVIEESFDYGLCKELVLNDPLYKDKITEVEKQIEIELAEYEKQEVEYKKQKKQEKEEKLISLGLTLKNPKSKLMEIGALVYEDYCVACHQQNGQGIAGIFPALAGSEVVLNNKTQHIEILMEGVQGAAMPSFAHQLSEGEIASVITFVSNSWGNDSYVTQPDDIQQYNEQKW